MARGEQAYLTAQSCYLIVANEADEWLFVHRKDTGYQDDAWGLPGGHVKPGERIDEAAVREGAEETGVVVDPSDLLLTYVLQRNKAGEGIEDRVDFYFTARKWSGTPRNMEPDRHGDLGWFSPDALPGKTVDFIGAACMAIVDGKRFGTFDF